MSDDAWIHLLMWLKYARRSMNSSEDVTMKYMTSRQCGQLESSKNLHMIGMCLWLCCDCIFRMCSLEAYSHLVWGDRPYVGWFAPHLESSPHTCGVIGGFIKQWCLWGDSLLRSPPSGRNISTKKRNKCTRHGKKKNLTPNRIGKLLKISFVDMTKRNKTQTTWKTRKQCKSHGENKPDTKPYRQTIQNIPTNI